MKEKFQDINFRPETLDMIARAVAICEDYARQGYDLSVRQLYYQFVKRNWIENKPEAYDVLADMVSNARLCGLMDWDFIKDRGRITHSNLVSPNLKAFMQSLNESFRIDKWKRQPRYVEVMVEKQALEGVLLPVCQKWDVPFTANKGYSSSSSMYERGKFIQSMRDVEKKDVYVIYLGDHDPSGLDMSRDIQDRLETFSDGPVNVMRVALNHAQVLRQGLLPNPAKLKDSRAKEYVAQYGLESWELDALEPSTLASIVTNGIKGLLDLNLWKEAEKEQQESQDRLQTIIDGLK